MKFKITSLATAVTLALAASLALASEGHDHDKNEPKKEETKKDPKIKPYKPDTCIVSDEKLGEMGKPVVLEYKGQEIKLCCKDCRKDFDKDPAKYLKVLEEKK